MSNWFQIGSTQLSIYNFVQLGFYVYIFIISEMKVFSTVKHSFSTLPCHVRLQKLDFFLLADLFYIGY